MPTISRYLDPLDLEKFSSCEKNSEILNTTDRSSKSFVESKLEIEIDSPEVRPELRPEPEYFLEKWPPEHTYVSDKPKQFIPEISSLP